MSCWSGLATHSPCINPLYLLIIALILCIFLIINKIIEKMNITWRIE